MKESFSDFCIEHNIRTITAGSSHKRSRNGWVQINCPYCGGGENKFHMGYNISKGFFVCWKCGWHPANKVLAELLGVSFNEGSKLFKNIEITHLNQIKTKGKLKLPKRISPLLTAHKQYLRSRGFKPAELASIWGLKGIGVSVKPWAWRIFIPITYQNQIVSYTTRSLNKDGLRYLSASTEDEAMPHKELLYGADLTTNTCIVVEGPTDAWNIGPGAVATCGIGFSPAQVLKIAKYPYRYICFDNSVSAQNRASELIDMLMVFPGCTYNIKLNAEDPGSATKKEINKLRKAVLK